MNTSTGNRERSPLTGKFLTPHENASATYFDVVRTMTDDPELLSAVDAAEARDRSPE